LANAAPAASDAQAKARAQALLTQGTNLYDQGDYAAALEKFTAAYALYPSPRLWFNIGQANRDLGRPVEALDAFQRFLADGPRTPEAADAVAEAQRSVEDLQQRLGQVRVTCTTAGAEVTVDGRRVGLAPIDRLVWTTPGRHQIAGRHARFAPAIEDVDVA